MDAKKRKEQLKKAADETVKSFKGAPAGITEAIDRLKQLLGEEAVSYWRQMKVDVFLASIVRAEVRDATDAEGQRLFESAWVEKDGKKTRAWGPWESWSREQVVQMRDEWHALELKYGDKVRRAEVRIAQIDRQQRLPGMGNGE